MKKIKQSDLKRLEKMGVKTEQIDAIKVIIETKDKIIIIENPMVLKASVMGQDAITITGGVIKEGDKNTQQPQNQQKVEIKEEDVKFIMEQTGKSEKEVREALVKAEGDIAKAIMILSGQQ